MQKSDQKILSGGFSISINSASQRNDSWYVQVVKKHAFDRHNKVVVWNQNLHLPTVHSVQNFMNTFHNSIWNGNVEFEVKMEVSFTTLIMCNSWNVFG